LLGCATYFSNLVRRQVRFQDQIDIHVGMSSGAARQKKLPGPIKMGWQR
jgi:hypothetical protein